MSRSTAALVLSLVALATGSAQEGIASRERAARIVVSCPAPEGPWILSAQDADGRVPARLPVDAGDATAPGSIRDVVTTALFALSILADGSTIRSGPQRLPAKRAVRWLVAQQDEHGRLGLHTEPDWIIDHAIATYALCEAGRRSEYTLMGKRFAPAIAVLTDHLRRFERGVDPELLVWSRLCARSGAAYEAWMRANDGPVADRGLGAAGLEEQVERLAGVAVATDERQRAAGFLLAALAEAPHDDVELGALAAPFVAEGWPTYTEDPITVLFGCLALYRLSALDPRSFEPPWRRVEKRLTDLVVETQVRDGDLRGSWVPRGACGDTVGRAGTTAVHALILTLYYRYCWLEPASP